MQQNPIEVLKIALMIAVPAGIAALTTWINITIRFAPDAAHAMREAKQIVARVVGWIAYIWIAGVIVWQFILPDPNPRLSLLIIILNSFALFNAYILWQLRSILKLLQTQAEHVIGLAEIVKTHIGTTKQVTERADHSN